MAEVNGLGQWVQLRAIGTAYGYGSGLRLWIWVWFMAIAMAEVYGIGVQLWRYGLGAMATAIVRGYSVGGMAIV